MPMYGSPMPPQMSPEEEARLRMQQGFDFGPGGFNASPLLPPPPAAPPLPDPMAAAMPPSANATGGPAGANAAIRGSVFEQLYRTGKRMAGKPNMFESFGPQPAAPVDPLAGMGAAPPPEPPFFLQASPNVVFDPAMLSSHLRQPMAPMRRPIDRFPGLASRMGRPVLPPTGQRGY